MDAAKALGLLDDDDIWKTTLQEASAYQMPKQLRECFCLIIIYSNPTDLRALWLEFKSKMSEDFVHQTANSDMSDEEVHLLAETRALMHIETILQERNDNYSLETIGIFVNEEERVTIRNLMQNMSVNISRAIAEETSTNEEIEEYMSELQNNLPSLNSQQRNIYERVINSFERNNNNIFFIDGPGGTGKTFLYNVILAKIRSEGHIALAVASSGIAALLIKKGSTPHSSFILHYYQIQSSHISR